MFIKLLRNIAIAPIYAYKLIISPFLTNSCRFLPTCSSYGIEVIQKFGIFRGSCLLCKRLLRCHPLGGSGFDPSP
jgi:putative membrane protein insertion efficiency factor